MLDDSGCEKAMSNSSTGERWWSMSTRRAVVFEASSWLRFSSREMALKSRQKMMSAPAMARAARPPVSVRWMTTSAMPGIQSRK